MQIIIYPPSNPIFLNIFGIDLRYYGIILTFAIFVGISFCYFLFLKKESKNEADFFIDYIPFVVLFAIFGARLFYVIGNLNFYMSQQKEIFFINHGGISIWGAIIFGIAGLILYLRHKKKDLFLHLDIIASVMPLCQAIGRFGNYFNQEAFGIPSNTFIKLYVNKAFRPDKYINYDFFHPAFLYESILDLIIFIILFCIIKYAKRLKRGTVFYLYIIFYSFARIMVESIRTDSVINIFNIPAATLISLFMILISIILLKKAYK